MCGALFLIVIRLFNEIIFLEGLRFRYSVENAFAFVWSSSVLTRRQPDAPGDWNKMRKLIGTIWKRFNFTFSRHQVPCINSQHRTITRLACKSTYVLPAAPKTIQICLAQVEWNVFSLIFSLCFHAWVFRHLLFPNASKQNQRKWMMALFEQSNSGEKVDFNALSTSVCVYARVSNPNSQSALISSFRYAKLDYICLFSFLPPAHSRYAMQAMPFSGIIISFWTQIGNFKILHK